MTKERSSHKNSNPGFSRFQVRRKNPENEKNCDEIVLLLSKILDRSENPADGCLLSDNGATNEGLLSLRQGE